MEKEEEEEGGMGWDHHKDKEWWAASKINREEEEVLVPMESSVASALRGNNILHVEEKMNLQHQQHNHHCGALISWPINLADEVKKGP